MNRFFNISLLVIFCVVWLNMYWANLAEYDQNYGYFIWSMILSFLTCLTIIILFFVRREFIKKSKMPCILFLLLGSPISIIAFIYSYQAFFGLYFKL